MRKYCRINAKFDKLLANSSIWKPKLSLNIIKGGRLMELNTGTQNLKVELELLGAANGIVTGSGNLLTIRRGNIVKKILIDYGLFQGEHENLNDPYMLDTSKIDFVLLTHAHLDHCGALPVLYRTNLEHEPYDGMIYASAETLDQAEHILRDSARLNMGKLNKILNEEEEFSDEELIMYLPEDAENAISHFCPVSVEEEISLCPGIDVKFIPNSHINGSTMIEVYVSYGAERYAIAFTGDVGKRKTPLYREMVYDKEPNVNAVVLESLHGVEEPTETYIDSIRIIKKILKRCIKEQKNLYIPVFALDRSAILLMVMNQIMDSGINFKCFFDSPLAEKELLCYMRAYNSGESKWFDYERSNPFGVDRIDFAEDYAGHMQIVKRHGPNVVITSSCMGYGGRVLDYFEHHIQDEDAVFVFPGFLPEGSPSKILCDASKGEIVEINDKRYIKHCEAYNLFGFSSHGYLEDKLEILDRYCNAQMIMLNHGDEESLNALEEYLSDRLRAYVLIPEICEKYELN